MHDEKERLQVAQWVLERNLAWIAAAETKVGVVVALDTAILGALGASFSAAKADVLTPWALATTIFAALLIAAGIFCSAMAVLPRVKGPQKSLVFFGRIGPCADADYCLNLKNASVEDLLEDWSMQIHRNAQIACEKFRWVRYGMWWSFVAIAPWFFAVVALLKKEG
ncbi:DUF5706 domain-containing protein [Chitiniphilus purpureus]|uniref:DUF5706 domain-containing protein n=1 Tax=Chitiniphilus purpureus TaxID=2981137 RepID=A0ABY6DQQ3_9NEIS|nr:Pycsar system effector family protein [Chitiniphilus sp. CD1]UXY16685.1 DUF5706 domain-containing protein [Chitiniphilus sp. CD1]